MNEEHKEDEIKPDQLQNLDDDKSTVISVVPSMLSGYPVVEDKIEEEILYNIKGGFFQFSNFENKVGRTNYGILLNDLELNVIQDICKIKSDGGFYASAMPRKLEVEQTKKNYLTIIPKNTDILPDTYPLRIKVENINYKNTADFNSVKLILNFIDVKEIILQDGNAMDDMQMKSKLNERNLYSLVTNNGVFTKKFHTEEVRAEINTEKLEGIKFKKWKNAYKFTKSKGQFRYFHDGREKNPTELLSFVPEDGSNVVKKDKNKLELLGNPSSETDYNIEKTDDLYYRSLNEFHLIELKSL